MKMQIKKIGDIFQISGRVRARAELFPVMSITMRYGLIDQSDKFKKRVASTNTSNYKIVYKNELVVGFPIDEGVIDFQTKYDQAIVSPAYDIWKLKDGILCNLGYLRRYLRSNKARRIYASKMRGAVARRRSITKDDFLSIQIPFPPLDDQIRIATVLTQAEKLIAKRKESIKMLDELLKSTFREMFGDPVRNEKGWELKKLPQLITKSKNSLKRGPFGGALKKEIFVVEGYLVYEQNHALNNDYSFKRYFIDKKKFEELKDFKVKAGDILISCSGVYLGKLSIVPEGALPGIINQALLKVTLNQKEMNQVFFVYVFSNPAFRNKYITSNRGSAIPNLPPMPVIKNIDFISPLIEVQNQFAAIVQKVESLKAKYTQSLTGLENLYCSLSQRAFKGELDLSMVPVEKEKQIVDLQGEIKETSSMTGELSASNEVSASKEYSEAELIKIIQSLAGKTFSFDSLMTELEKASFEEMPEYEELKKQIYKMLEGTNPLLSQTFDKVKKEIVLSVNK